MSNLTKGLVLVVVIMAIGVGLVVWKKKVGGSGHMSFNSISREEMELLLADVAKTNPPVLKRLKEDPEMKKEQLKSLKELLALASQAQHDGLTEEAGYKQELKNIQAEVQAVSYDREINKDKGPMPAFGFITEEQVKAYWDNTQPRQATFWQKIGLGQPVETRSHEDEFNDFINAKLEVLKAQNPDMADRQISDEEKTQAREVFAKTRIYRDEFEDKAAKGELPEDFVKKTRLQVKLQQAQFLARIYSNKISDQLKVTDEEIDAYIQQHPDISPESKKTQAQQVLDRAKGGEDFAALANEFSTDPGNQGLDGQKKGGLYEDVRKGQMVGPFETAALGLEPGQVAPELVQTDFGYHIIKLERKLGPSTKKPAADAEPEGGEAGEKKGDTYDVRHILISTGVKDPDDKSPMAREMPVREYVRAKLEEEKQKALLDKLIKQNNVHVAEDFTIPEVTEEQIQQMRQNQRPPMPQMPPPGEGPEGDTPAKPEAKKPEGKKK